MSLELAEVQDESVSVVQICLKILFTHDNNSYHITTVFSFSKSYHNDTPFRHVCYFTIIFLQLRAYLFVGHKTHFKHMKATRTELSGQNLEQSCSAISQYCGLLLAKFS
jgi:hypothetical protein